MTGQSVLTSCLLSPHLLGQRDVQVAAGGRSTGLQPLPLVVWPISILLTSCHRASLLDSCPALSAVSLHCPAGLGSSLHATVWCASWWLHIGVFPFPGHWVLHL